MYQCNSQIVRAIRTKLFIFNHWHPNHNNTCLLTATNNLRHFCLNLLLHFSNFTLVAVKLCTHTYYIVSMTTKYCLENSLKQFSLKLRLRSSNVSTVAHMEVKLGTYVYYIISMLATFFEHQQIASGTFFNITSSLLKLVNGSTHGDETSYLMHTFNDDYVISPRRAWAARVTVLGSRVCLLLCFLQLRATNQRYQRFIATLALFLKRQFSYNSKVMVCKASEQANMQISTGLPRPGQLALCTLEAQEVTMSGVYGLPHAAICYYGKNK